MTDKNDEPDEEPLNPFPDEAWIGCPHCEKPIDICAQIARARLDVGEFVLSLIFNGVRANKLAHPLELFNHECADLAERVRRVSQPLAHLNVYHLREPDDDVVFSAPGSAHPASGEEKEDART